MEVEPVTKSRMKDRESEEVLRILHVDNNSKFIDLVEKYLKRSQKNFKIIRAESSQNALEKLAENNIDCILSDYKMPEKDGLELLKDVRERYGQIPFILLTGKGSEEIASKAMSKGVTDYFKKKGKAEDYEVLAQRIDNAVSTYKAKNQRNKTLRRIKEGFVSLNTNYEIKYINKRARKQLNIPNKTIGGKKFWEQYEQESSLKEKIQRAYEEQIEIETTDYNSVNNKWFYIHIYPAEDSISLYLSDITKKKSSQQQNKEQLKQQKILADTAQRTINIDNEKELVNEVSEAIQKGIECKSLEINGEDLKTSKDNPKLNLSSYKLDIEVEDKKWGYLTIESTEKLRENDKKFLDSLNSVLSNSLKRINKEKEAEHFNKLVKGLNDTKYLINFDENIEYVNKAAEEIYEYQKEETINNDSMEHSPKVGDKIPVESSFKGYKVDTTRDIKKEQENKDELRKHKQIIETVDDGLYITNNQSEIEFANKAFLEIVDKPREEVIGESIVDILGLETGLCEKIEKLTHGEQKKIEEQGKLEKSDGEVIHFKNIFRLLSSDEEEFNGVLGLIKDVTDYEEQKESLKESKNESKKRVERLTANLPGASFKIQKNGDNWELESISDGVEDLLGKSADKILEEGWEELIFDEDLPLVKERLESREGDSHAVKFRIQNEDKVRWMLSKASSVDNEKETLEGILIDITDWKEYKRDLEKTQTLLEAAPEPMVILDRDLNIERVNKAGREIANLDEGELSSTDLKEGAMKIFYANKDRIPQNKLNNLDIKSFVEQKSRMKELKQDLNDFMQNDEKEQTSLETEVNLPSGNMLYVRFEVRKIYGEDGEVDGVAGVIHDITDMEKKTRSQRNKLDEFSSLVSHDLRNPLNLAQGYLDLARESESEEDFEVIEKAHTRMENIIDELLLITTEKDKIEKQEVNIREAFEEAFYFSGSSNLEYHVENDMEIYADRSGLVSIFENLISNSEEHNSGEIDVRVGRTDEGFYYEDNGDGIPEDIRNEIFEYGISSNNGGVGLSIVRRIAEINGWNVELSESDEGGARFEFIT